MISKTVEWRKVAIARVDRPTKIDRARSLGYKSKQGYAIARARISKGGRKRSRPKKGRKPGNLGIFSNPSQSKQVIAEKRVARAFPNLEVLNSFYAGEDGMYKYYEVILVDPNHPVIKSDPKINWICQKRRRVFRGMTSAAKRSRSLSSPEGWHTRQRLKDLR